MYTKTISTARSRRLICLLFAFVLVLSAVGCSGSEDNGETSAHVLAYEDVDVTEYVILGDYRDLTVTVEAGETEAQAIWRVIYDSSVVLIYPEAQLDYYVRQSRARCEYYASIHNVSYSQALDALGYTEESIVSEAEELVMADMIGIALRADAGISLTDDEKNKYFDKYAEKYAYDWGYNLAYVEEALREQVYDSMLYDKTTEYLLKHNTFVSAQ